MTAVHVAEQIVFEAHRVTASGAKLRTRRLSARCWMTRTVPGRRPVSVAT